MTFRDRLAFSGYCLAAIAFLAVTIESALWLRFGHDASGFFYQATLPGTWQQVCSLAYISAVVILLSIKE